MIETIVEKCEQIPRVVENGKPDGQMLLMSKDRRWSHSSAERHHLTYAQSSFQKVVAMVAGHSEVMSGSRKAQGLLYTFVECRVWGRGMAIQASMYFWNAADRAS
jgi:hypothetical protein